MLTTPLLTLKNQIQKPSITVFKPPQTDCSQHFNDQCSHYIEPSQLICFASQLTGFYMMGTLVVKRLIFYRKKLLTIWSFPQRINIPKILEPDNIIVHEGVCITANGNIVASGNLCFRVFNLPLKVINKNFCYLYSV